MWKAAQREVGAADHHHVFSGDVGADPGAGERNLVLAAHAQPRSREDGLALEGEDPGIEMRPRRELGGALERGERSLELGALERKRR